MHRNIIGINYAKIYLQTLLSLAPMPVCRKTSLYDLRIAQNGLTLGNAAGRRSARTQPIQPYRISASLKRFQSTYLMQDYRQMLRFECDTVEAHLPAAAKADAAGGRGRNVILGFQTWRLLRHDQLLQVSGGRCQSGCAAIAGRCLGWHAGGVMQRVALPLSLALLLSACQDASPPSGRSCAGLTDNNMVWVSGGSFVMGDEPQYPEEGPPRSVTVKGFWIDAHEVTNAEFAEFVKATGYKTMAERDSPKLPNAPPEMLVPGSAVFTVPSEADPRWWRWVAGAQWRHPSGVEESIAGRDREPVVQIAYQDAEAFAKWAGKQLPSEAQWEYAARGGAASLPEPVDAEGQPQANYYQGIFPIKNLNSDGYVGRAPVGCFKPNRFGLYDMIGNVWEWTSASGSRADAGEPVNVIKGGSYLCAANYCARYRPAARQFQERGLGTDHIGFRLVDGVKPGPAE